MVFKAPKSSVDDEYDMGAEGFVTQWKMGAGSISPEPVITLDVTSQVVIVVTELQAASAAAFLCSLRPRWAILEEESSVVRRQTQ